MMQGGYSLGSDDDGVEITVAPPCQDGGDCAAGTGDGETYSFTWEELGIGAEAAKYASSGGVEPVTWVASFGGTPQRATTVDLQTVIAADVGFFATTFEGLWFSADGVTWSKTETPDDVVYPAVTLATDGGAVVLAISDDDTTSAFFVDDSLTWTPVAIDGLPPYVQNSLTGSATSAAIIAVGEQDDSFDIPIEFGGFTLTQHHGRREFGYSLVESSSGGVVQSENVDLSEVSGDQPFANLEFVGSGGIVVTDDAGAVLVEIPESAVAAAYQAAEPVGPLLPDLWLVAVDGASILVEDLADPEPAAGSDPREEWQPRFAVANGSTVLTGRMGGQWTVYRFDS
jgi:hypothetical protein